MKFATSSLRNRNPLSLAFSSIGCGAIAPLEKAFQAGHVASSIEYSLALRGGGAVGPARGEGNRHHAKKSQ